ncbi:MAG: type IV conjugative transfer system lipoprotein TraV, partial [Gammaproteobacteria bacterium]
MNPHLKFSSIAMITILLTGCASTGSSNFSCPSPNTGMCKPIHDVDKMVSQGQIGQDNSVISANAVSASQTAGAFNNFSTPYPSSVITPGAPLRVQEQVMAVWIAPYQDKQDNYHEPSTLYTVILPGQWAANP